MSSGFVSGGTTDRPIERDDEWLKAQQEIEAKRRRNEEEMGQGGGKTLYEVLQSNKAAKQDAFEESVRLKNQFRNLDEDEIEFLDSVLESTRKKEEEVKKQTSEQLDLFRQQQEEADRAAIEGNGGVGADGNSSTGDLKGEWAVNRGKRKRAEDKNGLPGLKIRKASSTKDGIVVDTSVTSSLLSPPPKPTSEPQLQTAANSTSDPSSTVPVAETVKQLTFVPKASIANSSNLGLAGYSSDEED